MNWTSSSLKAWLAEKLRPYLRDELARAARPLLLRRLFDSYQQELRSAVHYASRKVSEDVSLKDSPKRREEACEWTRHHLRDQGEHFPNKDINLAVEVFYQLEE